MAARAATTTRIKLGQMCTAMSYRNPVYSVKVAATTDVISGGRVQMGSIGGGWYEHEWRAYGYGSRPPGVRLGRLDEGVQIMRDAWRDGRVSFDGKHYQAQTAPSSHRSHCRTTGSCCGSRAAKVTLRIAAEYAQYTNFTSEPGGFCPYKSQILAGTVSDVGTDYDAIVRSANFNAVIGESDADGAWSGSGTAEQGRWIRRLSMPCCADHHRTRICLRDNRSGHR